MIRWAVKWSSKTKLDGHREHFVNEGLVPVLFATRERARDFVTQRYGYIRSRPDLRTEPHGWKIPQPVRVRVKLIEI